MPSGIGMGSGFSIQPLHCMTEEDAESDKDSVAKMSVGSVPSVV